ncbi:MAG: DUF1634 domain-containing protein [Candidatus Acidiferrales bacterium]
MWLASLRKRLGEREIELLIGQLLRAGVLLAAATVFIGGALYLWQSGRTTPNYHVFRGETHDLRHAPAIARHALSLQPLALIQFGLLLLIVTPIARVAFSAFAFAIERDWLYVAFTIVVLAILLFSLSGT